MRTSRWVAALPLLALLTGCAGGEAARPPEAGPSPRTAAPVADPTASSPPDGIGRVASEAASRDVGTLFQVGGSGHFCSGTVVTGGAADLVVTAAHCVSATHGAALRSSLEYAPSYRQGTSPYGRWEATRVFVDPRWTATRDPDLDVAFIQLAPRDGKRVADVVGAQRIAFNTPSAGTVRLTGYPSGADDPVTCLGVIGQRGDGQLRVACTGYSAGTSGSPWLTDFDPASRTWAVVGVIGGDELGGDSDDVSYSPYFGTDVRKLYEQAVVGAGS